MCSLDASIIGETVRTILLTLAVLLAACSTPAADEPQGTPEPAATTATDTASPTESEQDTAEVGDTVQVGDWQVTLADVDTDPDSVTGDPPADGNLHVLLTIEGTYAGDTTGDLHMDASWTIVTDNGEYSSVRDRCGMLEQPMRDAGDTDPGEQVSGQVCMTVPEDELDNATVQVSTIEASPDTATYTLG